jgi:prepilin-type processing-associated H-X9-DG protein
LSNEFSTPKLLICPADKEREEATNFATLRRQNVSYFLAPNAREVFPQSFLAGDRNLTTNGVRIGPGRVELKDPAQTGWDETIHKSQGNVAMGDGSVQQLSIARLRDQLKYAETNTVLLVP